MKHFKFNTLLFVVVVLIYSCNSQRKIANSRVNNKSYIEYLSSVINDTTFFEFPELKIVDSSIYPLLDSVIFWSEKCKYFDARIKSLYSFRFGIMYKNGKPSYSIDAHDSPAQAIGLILLRTGVLKQLDLCVFYYKHYLFVASRVENYNVKELEYFPFLKQSGNKLKIRAPEFIEKKAYSSYITFDRINGNYKISEKEVCGGQIMIGGKGHSKR